MVVCPKYPPTARGCYSHGISTYFVDSPARCVHRDFNLLEPAAFGIADAAPTPANGSRGWVDGTCSAHPPRFQACSEGWEGQRGHGDSAPRSTPPCTPPYLIRGAVRCFVSPAPRLPVARQRLRVKLLTGEVGFCRKGFDAGAISSRKCRCAACIVRTQIWFGEEAWLTSGTSDKGRAVGSLPWCIHGGRRTPPRARWKIFFNNCVHYSLATTAPRAHASVDEHAPVAATR